MSRIGKKEITLPKGVEFKIDGQKLSVKGPKGKIEKELHKAIGVKNEGGVIRVTPYEDTKENRRYHGLTRTIVNNMVIGVSEGFTRNLTLVGVGYKAQSKGKGLTLNLGHSHPIDYDAPAGIELKVDKLVNISVVGVDKEVVGQVAATIRGFRPPEPYHGKGVRYADEVIKTKVGKAAGKK